MYIQCEHDHKCVLYFNIHVRACTQNIKMESTCTKIELAYYVYRVYSVHI